MLSARAAKCRVSGRGRRKGTFRSISFAMTRSRRATSATAVEKVFTTWRNATHEGLVARWSTESNRAPPALATDESCVTTIGTTGYHRSVAVSYTTTEYWGDDHRDHSRSDHSCAPFLTCRGAVR